MSRKDSAGDFWLLSIVVGVLTQYASDVVANICNGETGMAVLAPTSTIGEYIAAGATTLITGSGMTGALVRNITTEVIVGVEKAILGEEIDFVDSLKNVAVGTVLDAGFEWISDKVVSYIDSTIPKNYSSYAHSARQFDPSLTQQQIYHSMQRSIRVKRMASKITHISFGIINECVKE